MENSPLKVGDQAPDFELMNQNKDKVKLSDFRGKKKIVLLFYPMDFSGVCTQEHCTVGPKLGRLTKDKDTILFGVSCDSPFSHAAFQKQNNIPYDLLADPTRKMAKAYGMWAGEEPFNCSKRGTVVIGKDGKVTFYKEQPMKDARTIEELKAATRVKLMVRIGGIELSQPILPGGLAGYSDRAMRQSLGAGAVPTPSPRPCSMSSSATAARACANPSTSTMKTIPSPAKSSAASRTQWREPR